MSALVRGLQLALWGASLGALAGLGRALVELRLEDYVSLGYLRSAVRECALASAHAGLRGAAAGLALAVAAGLASRLLLARRAPGEPLAWLHSEAGSRWTARLAAPAVLAWAVLAAVRRGGLGAAEVGWLAVLAAAALLLHLALRPWCRRAALDPGARAGALAGYAAGALLLAGVWLLDAGVGRFDRERLAWNAVLAVVALAAFVSLRVLLARPARALDPRALAVLAPALLPPLLLLGVAPRVAPGVEARNPKNVLLVGIDTLRADHTSLYGSGRDGRRLTPHLEALAARGTRFSRAISQAPWTMPSFASILTGRYPAEHGAYSLTGRLRRKELTLAEVLREAGWSTGAVVSHDFVARKHGFGQGFESFDESQVRGSFAVTSSQVTDRAVDWLRRHRGERFFLFAHYFDPHFRYFDHAEYPWADAYQGWLRREKVHIYNFRNKRNLMGPDEIRWLSDLYDEEIAYTDREVGRLLDALRELGLEDDTAVVVVSDHGEEFMERGWLGHTINLDQEVIRVPLVMVLPGVDGPGEVARAVETRAVFPTLLDYLGVGDRARPGSLLPAMRGEDDGGGEAVFSMAWLDEWACVQNGKCMRLSAVEHDGWRLVVDHTRDVTRLYDVRRDPLERDDRSAQEAERLGALRRELDAWEARMTGEAGPEKGADLSDDEKARLRALGYL